MRAPLTVSIGLTVVLLPFLAATPPAHAGEDHETLARQTAVAASPRLVATSDELELGSPTHI